jgi:hypothetical protein|tara:strand:+ start:1614 stop:1787 length:174 start_codon:yes stop_codon:yes gene_type:complete
MVVNKFSKKIQMITVYVASDADCNAFDEVINAVSNVLDLTLIDYDSPVEYQLEKVRD